MFLLYILYTVLSIYRYIILYIVYTIVYIVADNKKITVYCKISYHTRGENKEKTRENIKYLIIYCILYIQYRNIVLICIYNSIYTSSIVYTIYTIYYIIRYYCIYCIVYILDNNTIVYTTLYIIWLFTSIYTILSIQYIHILVNNQTINTLLWLLYIQWRKLVIVFRQFCISPGNFQYIMAKTCYCQTTRLSRFYCLYNSQNCVSCSYNSLNCQTIDPLPPLLSDRAHETLSVAT